MGVHTSKIHLLISVTIYMFKTAKQQLKTKQRTRDKHRKDRFKKSLKVFVKFVSSDLGNPDQW